MRILDGLTVLSGDPKYREIAYEQYQYYFDNLVDDNGLLYTGPHVLIDVMTGDHFYQYHETKDYQLPWNLMWVADSESTQRFIEAYWNAHAHDISVEIANEERGFNSLRPKHPGDWWLEGGLEAAIDHILVRDIPQGSVRRFERYMTEEYLLLSDHAPVYVDMVL